MTSDQVKGCRQCIRISHPKCTWPRSLIFNHHIGIDGLCIHFTILPGKLYLEFETYNTEDWREFLGKELCGSGAAWKFWGLPLGMLGVCKKASWSLSFGIYRVRSMKFDVWGGGRKVWISGRRPVSHMADSNWKYFSDSVAGVGGVIFRRFRVAQGSPSTNPSSTTVLQYVDSELDAWYFLGHYFIISDAYRRHIHASKPTSQCKANICILGIWFSRLISSKKNGILAYEFLFYN